MNQTEALTPSEIHNLEIYKTIVSGKPLNQAITLEDLVFVKELTETIPKLEEEAKPFFEEIQSTEDLIAEKMQHIQELRQSIDQRLIYLKMNPDTRIQPLKSVTNGKEEYKDINPESITAVLKDVLKYGGSNSQIAKELSLDNTKNIQNKIYSTCLKMFHSGILDKSGHLWKLK